MTALGFPSRQNRNPPANAVTSSGPSHVHRPDGNGGHSRSRNAGRDDQSPGAGAGGASVSCVVVSCVVTGTSYGAARAPPVLSTTGTMGPVNQPLGTLVLAGTPIG